MEAGERLGRELADRHHELAGAEPVGSVINYAERPRSGDWTMRSALVRLAQPEPSRVAEVLELSRRLDSVLGHVSRALEKQSAICDRRLATNLVDGSPDATIVGPPVDPYPDARVVDLARACRALPDIAEGVLAGYSAQSPLSAEETAAVPLLVVALSFDDLAEVLVAWAIGAPSPAPLDVVDDACRDVRRRLDELGVPVEQPRPQSARGRG